MGLSFYGIGLLWTGGYVEEISRLIDALHHL